MSTVRSTPYQIKPAEQWLANMIVMSNTTLLLVSRPGPTVFGIQDESANLSFKVVLGNPHSCTCREQQCVHQLFCLLKVLRIPDSNVLAWQTSFTDSEMNQVLNKSFDNGLRDAAIRRHLFLRRKVMEAQDGAGAGDNSDSKVQRQALGDEEEDVCPICQDHLYPDQALSWCRNGCGNNVHAKCMQSYAQYKANNKDSVGCPLCRVPWALDKLRDDCRGKASFQYTCAPVKCHACLLSPTGVFYRCLECSHAAMRAHKRSVDICPRCFTSICLPRDHAMHHFVSSSASVSHTEDVQWVAVSNPRATQRAAITSESAITLQQLQERELTAADYDVLLTLDQLPPTPELSSQLAQSLPRFASIECVAAVGERAAPISSSSSVLCWCDQDRGSNASATNTDERDGDGEGASLRQLPLCRHFAHSACIRAKIDRLLAADSSASASLSDSPVLTCGHADCKKLIFSCLSRRRRKKKKPAVLADNSAATTTVAPIAVGGVADPSLRLFGVTGVPILSQLQLQLQSSSAALTPSLSSLHTQNVQATRQGPIPAIASSTVVSVVGVGIADVERSSSRGLRGATDSGIAAGRSVLGILPPKGRSHIQTGKLRRGMIGLGLSSSLPAGNRTNCEFVDKMAIVSSPQRFNESYAYAVRSRSYHREKRMKEELLAEGAGQRSIRLRIEEDAHSPPTSLLDVGSLTLGSSTRGVSMAEESNMERRRESKLKMLATTDTASGTLSLQPKKGLILKLGSCAARLRALLPEIQASAGSVLSTYSLTMSSVDREVAGLNATAGTSGDDGAANGTGVSNGCFLGIDGRVLSNRQGLLRSRSAAATSASPTASNIVSLAVWPNSRPRTYDSSGRGGRTREGGSGPSLLSSPARLPSLLTTRPPC